MPSHNISDAPDRIVRETECKAISGLSRTTRWRLEQSGDFPRRRRISPGLVGWLLSELMERQRRIAESDDALPAPEAALEAKKRAAEPADAA